MAGDDEIQEHSVAKLSVIFLSTGNYIRLKYSEAAPSSGVPALKTLLSHHHHIVSFIQSHKQNNDFLSGILQVCVLKEISSL